MVAAVVAVLGGPASRVAEADQLVVVEEVSQPVSTSADQPTLGTTAMGSRNLMSLEGGVPTVPVATAPDSRQSSNLLTKQQRPEMPPWMTEQLKLRNGPSSLWRL